MLTGFRVASPRTFRRRHGIALLIALGLLTLLGLLIAGAVAATVLAQRSARLADADPTLTASAEYAITTVLADPHGFGLADLSLGAPSIFDVDVPTPGVTAKVAVTRLVNGVLWLIGDAATASPDHARRRISVVARFPSPGTLPGAAIVARGSVIVRNVTFATASTGDAECTPPQGAAVVVAPGASVSVDSGVSASIATNAADSASYLLTERQLALLDRGSGVLHVRGDTTIAGGSFAGILIVDGTLEVTGPFTVTGLVVAKGPVIATVGGFIVMGSLMSFAAAPATAIDLIGATMRFSPCEIAHAERLALSPVRVPERSWAEIY